MVSLILAVVAIIAGFVVTSVINSYRENEAGEREDIIGFHTLGTSASLLQLS